MHNYLPGFINQFEEGGEYQELRNEDWSVSQFLKWLELNKFSIVKDGEQLLELKEKVRKAIDVIEELSINEVSKQGGISALKLILNE